MRYYEFPLNDQGTAMLYCKIYERPLTEAASPNPAFLWIPGGGFFACAPEDGETILLTLGGHGYSGFTMTYPAAEHYRFPDVLVLVSKAILLIRAHAQAWNIDPNRIVIGGGSAGGFISGAYAALWNHPEMRRRTLCQNGENRPNALLTVNGLFYAYQQTTEGIVKVPVYDYIGEDMPPAFILHTSDDVAVHVDQALAMAWHMSRAKRPFAMYISDSGNHTGLQNATRMVTDTGKLIPKVDDWLQPALIFLDNALGVEPKYEQGFFPQPGSRPGEVDSAPQSVPEMHTGDFESGMVWGFVPEKANELEWEK